jgi:hypothetical protein
MELIYELITLFQTFWEVFVAAAVFQIELNQAVEGMCGMGSFFCALYGFWLVVRLGLVLLGLFTWTRLNRESTLIL